MKKQNDEKPKAEAKSKAEEKAPSEFTRSRISNLFRRANGSYYGRVKIWGKIHKKSFGQVPLAEAEHQLGEWLAQVKGIDYATAETSVNTVGDSDLDGKAVSHILAAGDVRLLVNFLHQGNRRLKPATWK
jgi:hypothetical protein